MGRVTELHVGGQLHVAQNIPGGIPDPISPICLGGGILPPINGTAWIEGPALVGTPLSYPTPRAPMATMMLGRSTNKTAPWPTVPSILKVTTLAAGPPTPLDILLGDPGAGMVGITINSLLIKIINATQISVISPNTTGLGNLTWTGKIIFVGPVTIVGSLTQTGKSVFNGKGTRNGKENINGKLAVAGNVSIGGKLSVAGPISSPTITLLKAKIASKKSFDISHPTKQNHRLRYICIEGPSAEVYYRGKLEGDNIIELPEYWSNLVDIETVGVTLTPIGQYQELYVEKIEWGKKIIIKNNLASAINCHYVVYGERKDVEKNIPEYLGSSPKDYPGDNSEYAINVI
jgi:hypothetical protein